jgi:osmoprotectant transport system substrate-binding protein
MAEALKNGTIDVAELCSTQPDILVNGWVLLDDDKKTQPADNIAPIVRNDYLAKIDRTGFVNLLDSVSARMDTATLARLYKTVNVDRGEPRDVARDWLRETGIVPGCSPPCP